MSHRSRLRGVASRSKRQRNDASPQWRFDMLKLRKQRRSTLDAGIQCTTHPLQVVCLKLRRGPFLPQPVCCKSEASETALLNVSPLQTRHESMNALRVRVARSIAENLPNFHRSKTSETRENQRLCAPQLCVCVRACVCVCPIVHILCVRVRVCR